MRAALLYRVLPIFCVFLGATGCGGSSAARKDLVSSVPSNVTVPPLLLKNQTQVLVDLLDREISQSSGGRAKRLRFFKSISSATVEATLQIQLERAKLFEFKDAQKNQSKIPTKLMEDFKNISARYRSKDLDSLFARVDVIPLDLLFAQAAIESGSGTSAVAKNCNNLFGVHAATPAQACPGHPILTYYPDFRGSIQRYALLLNSGSAFKDFRVKRRDLRASVGEKGFLVSDSLVGGLRAYSERGDSYLRDVKSMIQSDRLDELNQDFFQRVL